MALTIALSVLIGISLGLLGGGGSILTVPILVYVAGLEPKEGIATSLLVVGASSLTAVLFHARSGRVDWRAGSLFGVASMVGAFSGGSVAKFLPAWLLLVGFTLMMFVTSLAMMRRRQDSPPPMGGGSHSPAYFRVAAIGIGIGLLTGVIGAGGGFVIVPALLLLNGLSMQAAIGTSLLVIAMNSLAGFAGTLGHVSIHWSLALAVAVASVIGSVVGASLVGQVKPGALRKGFAWFVLAMATFMTVKLLPIAFTNVMLRHLPIIAVGMIAVSLLAGVVFARTRGLRPQVLGVPLGPLQSTRHSENGL